jgi:acyl-CoA thioesterase FadM
MRPVPDPPFIVASLRPRYEGANIRTWIGFKHLMYLAHEAVLEWFRSRGAGPQALFHEHGLGLEIVDASAQMSALLDVDDSVAAEVSALGQGRFSIRLRSDRNGSSATILRGTFTVRLARLTAPAAALRLPEDVAALVGIDTDPGAGTRHRLEDDETPEVRLTRTTPGAFYWCWRARYFQCHCTDRVHHSAFVRALEEVVDRFLAARGLSIGSLLAARNLIPIVSRVRVQTLDTARLEEDVHTTFVVDDVLKATAFDGRMDCYVRRGDWLEPVATARILHGYAFSAGESAGRLAVLDEGMLRALSHARDP